MLPLCIVLGMVWCAFTICSVLVYISPGFSSIAKHGKMSYAGAPLNTYERWCAGVAHWQVPKRWFVHFYVLGTVSGVAGLLVSILSLDCSVDRSVGYLYQRICLVLFEVHVLRRLWECHTIATFGQSSMHIAGYLCGLIHYALTPVSMMCSCLQIPFLVEISDLWPANLVSIKSRGCVVALWPAQTLFTAGGLVLFLSASVAQYKCHAILYRLKKVEEVDLAGSPKSRYGLPVGFGFDFVCCPHYFAEILIYVSFWFINMGNVASLLEAVWVTSNLAVVAVGQKRWYLETFPEECKISKRGWKALVPGVW